MLKEMLMKNRYAFMFENIHMINFMTKANYKSVCSEKETLKGRTPQVTLENLTRMFFFPRQLHFVNCWISFF